MLEAACEQLDVIVVDQSSVPIAAPANVDVDLDAGTDASLYSDSGCTTPTTSLTIASGETSALAFVRAEVAASFSITATDASGTLTEDTVSVQVDALLMADYAVSTFAVLFNSGAWTTVEEAAGVPMEVTVTVPPTGTWYIDVQARGMVLEPAGVSAIRLRESTAVSTATVDYTISNSNDNETTPLPLFYVNNTPVNGETYTYFLEATGGDASNKQVNPAQFNFGPAGDQVSAGRSAIMAVVRPARGKVD